LQHSFPQDDFDPRNSPANPMMDSTTPPMIIHIALSVGEPVKSTRPARAADMVIDSAKFA